MGLDFNATILAQIIDFLILLLIISGIITIILRGTFKKNIFNKIAQMDSELKEIRRLLEEQKHTEQDHRREGNKQ